MPVGLRARECGTTADSCRRLARWCPAADPWPRARPTSPGRRGCRVFAPSRGRAGRIRPPRVSRPAGASPAAPRKPRSTSPVECGGDPIKDSAPVIAPARAFSGVEHALLVEAHHGPRRPRAATVTWTVVSWEAPAVRMVRRSRSWVWRLRSSPLAPSSAVQGSPRWAGRRAPGSRHHQAARPRVQRALRQLTELGIRAQPAARSGRGIATTPRAPAFTRTHRRDTVRVRSAPRDAARSAG